MPMPITQLTDPNFRHTWHTRANDIVVTIKEKLIREPPFTRAVLGQGVDRRLWSFQMRMYRLLTDVSSWLCVAHTARNVKGVVP